MYFYITSVFYIQIIGIRFFKAANNNYNVLCAILIVLKYKIIILKHKLVIY